MPQTGGVNQIDKAVLVERARALMETYNIEAETAHVWMRTLKHTPAQLPWFTAPDLTLPPPPEAVGHEAANRLKPVAHRWAWTDVSPFVDKMAGLAQEVGIEPLEVADRQSVMFLNPGLRGRIQATNTIRLAVSVYNPGDDATAHVHSPNASRTILSPNGGYTTVEGERCDAARGDIILTPNGTWHHHGNDGDSPVVWLDTLDWPLIEYVDATWLATSYVDLTGNGFTGPTTFAPGYSQRAYGGGGIVSATANHQRGFGQAVSPKFHYKGSDIRASLLGLSAEARDPFEAVKVDLVNPVTGGPVFPTLNYAAQLIPPGEATLPKRETSSSYFIVMDGSGYSEINGQRFEWARNDVVCIPGFAWREHVNDGESEAILYSVSDSALMRGIGQYRAQGINGEGRLVELS